MDGQVPSVIKSERFNRLLELQNQKSIESNLRYIGKIVEVLTEGYTDEEKTTMTGRTDENIIVKFPAEAGVLNEFVKVKIERAANWAIFGRVVK